MWDLPRPGIEPVFPALAGGFFTTRPPRKFPTWTHTHSQSDFPNCISKGNRVLKALIRTHVNQNATEQLGQFSWAQYPPWGPIFCWSLLGISAWMGAWDRQHEVTSHPEQPRNTWSRLHLQEASRLLAKEGSRREGWGFVKPGGPGEFLGFFSF